MLEAPPTEWCPEMAYLSGLIASDGCLQKTRTLSITSTEPNLVKTSIELLARLGTKGSAGTAKAYTQSGKEYWQVQWTDYRMYNCLLDIGLTQRKSNIMPALKLPKDEQGYNHFWAFCRGMFDGDGSLPRNKDGNFAGVRIVSGSPLFIQWFQKELYKRGIYNSIVFKSAKEKEAQILQIHVQYIPMMYRKMYSSYPQFKGMGHREKYKRFRSRQNNIEMRPYLRKKKLTLPKIQQAILSFHQEFYRWPNKLEYMEFRDGKLATVKDSRDFPDATCIYQHFCTWPNLIAHMEKEFPEYQVSPHFKMEKSMLYCYQELGRWPSSYEYNQIRNKNPDKLYLRRNFPSVPILIQKYGGWEKIKQHMGRHYAAKDNYTE